MKLIKFAGFAALLFLSTAFNVKQAKSDWLNGKWWGMKYQVDMAKGWQTELGINTKTNKFTVSYPELDCTGTLELQSMSKNKAVFIEKLPNSSCLSDGYIIITKVDETHISFTCLRENNKRLASYCTLTKI
ncbi:MAG: hypothetical protein K0R65_2340 [Crocinitomicaceae bacterium]|nr:hypothetical protein [Crocinitomicaceae bacterium]